MASREFADSRETTVQRSRNHARREKQETTSRDADIHILRFTESLQLTEARSSPFLCDEPWPGRPWRRRETPAELGRT